MEPLSAPKNLENHNRRLSFQISCSLPHQKMLLNLYYQSWQRQTMLRNTHVSPSVHDISRPYSQRCNCSHTVISLLAQCLEIRPRTCQSSSNLDIFIRYSWRLESVLKGLLYFIGTKQQKSCQYLLRYILQGISCLTPNVTFITVESLHFSRFFFFQ